MSTIQELKALTQSIESIIFNLVKISPKLDYVEIAQEYDINLVDFNIYAILTYYSERIKRAGFNKVSQQVFIYNQRPMEDRCLMVMAYLLRKVGIHVMRNAYAQRVHLEATLDTQALYLEMDYFGTGELSNKHQILSLTHEESPVLDTDLATSIDLRDNRITFTFVISESM